MKKSVHFLLMLSALIFSHSYAGAAVIGPLEEIKRALDQQVSLAFCAKENRQQSAYCQNTIESLKNWNLDPVKEVLEGTLDLVHAAVVQDEDRLKEIAELSRQQPKGQYHYNQILSYGQLKLKDISKHMRSTVVIVPDLKMYLQNADLTELRYVELLKEKLLNLKAHVEMAVGMFVADEAYDKTRTILEHARKGSVIHEVAAGNDRVAGMLPFFCEDDSKRGAMLPCSDYIIRVRFHVPLLRKIIGVGRQDPVQIVVQKTFTEDKPVIQMFSGMLSGMSVDVEKRTISVNYYDVSRCGVNGHARTGILGRVFCDDKIYMQRVIEPRQNIEDALFNLIGETDQSLKLH